MKRVLVIAIPTAAIALFILLMISDSFLKYPFGPDDDVPGSIIAVTVEITGERWDAAAEKTDQLADAWQKVAKRIQFSAENHEISEFNKSLARLRGALMAKDKSGALMELQEALEHWKNVGK